MTTDMMLTDDAGEWARALQGSLLAALRRGDLGMPVSLRREVAGCELAGAHASLALAFASAKIGRGLLS